MKKMKETQGSLLKVVQSTYHFPEAPHWARVRSIVKEVTGKSIVDSNPVRVHVWCATSYKYTNID